MPIDMRLAPLAAPILLLAGCANLATVRTLSGALATAGSQTTTLAHADNATCGETNALIGEYNQIMRRQSPDAAPIAMVGCDHLARTIDLALAESQAITAYAQALGQLAQDQYVTATNDAGAVAGAARAAGARAPVAGAIQSVLGAIESWALLGYRQNRIAHAMSPATGAAVKTVVADLRAVSGQYVRELHNEATIITAMLNGAPTASSDPLALGEFTWRLNALKADIAARQQANAHYLAALDALPDAWDAALHDLHHPDAKAIAASVKTFATEVQSARQSLDKAL